MLFAHGINSSYSKMTENRSGKAQHDNPAPSKHQANVLSETLEPGENSRIPKIAGMDSRPLHLEDDPFEQRR